MGLCSETIKRTIRRLLDWIPQQFFPEFKALLLLAWPIILMNLFRFLNPTISVIMCGHLRKIDFDAAALANALINVFGVSVDLGFSTSCETLFSQIYGSENKKRLGLMLQRATLVMTVTYLILACFHLNIEPLLILLQQDVEISRLTAKYVTLYLPGLFFDFHFLTISRYLQNQNIVYPMMISSGIGCLYNGIAQYIAIYVFNYGIEASAIIQGSTCFLMFILQFAYILVTKVYKSTWQGIEFSNALQGWGIFFKLGIPGIIMISVEEWTFEIANFLAGSMSDVQLGGQSIAFQVEVLCYMIHAGLAIGVAIRAGQFLGANKPVNASLSAKVVLITDMGISILTASTVFAFRKFIPFIFSNDSEIRDMAEKILIFVGSIQFTDAILSSCCAIFRACGKQLIGAVVMFVSYYIVGVPLGFTIVFLLKTDIRGFWMALIIACAIEIIIYLALVYRIDWGLEAYKTQIRIKESQLSRDEFEDFSDTNEKSVLIKKDDDYNSILGDGKSGHNVIFPIAQRRPSSNVTDIVISNHHEIPNIGINNELDNRTIFHRIIFCGIVLCLFITSILLKIYLPRGLYIPCIPVNSNNTKLSLNKHYPFCNDTLYFQ